MLRTTPLAILLLLHPPAALADPVPWDVAAGGNGHLYEAVLFEEPITWDEARADALARGGDLVSIGSAAENDFVFTLIDAPELWTFTGVHNYGPWIGGFQDDLGAEPAGNWIWSDGAPWTFTAWASSQPDNAGAAEHAAHYFVPSDARGSTWNDWTDGGLLIASYVFEAEAPVCGDGVTGPGEACDDGNTVAGDGCSAVCTLEAPGACPLVPATGCVAAERASVKLSERKAGREKLSARLAKLEEPTGQVDFGDPVTGTTAWALCLYDAASALVLGLEVERAGDACGPRQKPCWKAKSTKGYAYKDPEAAAGGVRKIAARSGPIGKGMILLRAGNQASRGQTSLPTGAAAALQGAASATLQVITSDALCYEAALGTVKKADGTELRAKAP